MLHLYIGRRKGYFLSGDGVFDFNFDCSYLLTDFSKKVIKAIDKSEVVDKNVIVSPILLYKLQRFWGVPQKGRLKRL